MSIVIVCRPWERPVEGPGRASKYRATWTSIITMLRGELKAIRVAECVLEMAVTANMIRNDGFIYSNARPSMPGVRVSFASQHGPLCYETSAWSHWTHNVYAIARTLRSQRMIALDGCVRGDQAYRGWRQLPGAGRGSAATPPAGVFSSREDAAEHLCRVAWPEECKDRTKLELLMHSALGRNGYRDDMEVAYRVAARSAHPDAGGSGVLMMQVNAARDYLEQARVSGGAA